jgi:hypothetical protein
MKVTLYIHWYRIPATMLFALQVVLDVGICTSDLDLLYPADEPTFQAMNGLMEQFFRIVSVFILFQMLGNNAEGIIYHLKQY